MASLGRFAREVASRSPIPINQTLHSLSQWAISVYNPGMNVYSRDWEVLIILDACRPDTMRKIGPEYGFDTAETVWSVANMSDEWMERTFIDEYTTEIENTLYVSGNPFTQFHELDDLHDLREVWQYAWDEKIKGVPARPVTDTALTAWSDTAAERMIIHYMQPHFPSIPHPDVGEFGDIDTFGYGWDTVWEDAGDTIPWDVVREAYEDNLRYVLEEINLLLDNLVADRVSITSDHANAMGEFGFRGHPNDVLHPSIRRVPWTETTGRGPGEYESTADWDEGEADTGIEEQLEALGYY